MDEDGVALRLGRIVLAGAELEFQVRVFVAEFSQKSPRPRGMRDELLAIRRGSRGTKESAEIANWTHDVDDILKRRGALAHGSFIEFWDGPGTHQGFMAHKTFNEISVDLRELDALVDRARAAIRVGDSIQNRIMDGFVELNLSQLGADAHARLIWSPPKCPAHNLSMELQVSIESPRYVCPDPECEFVRSP